MYLFRQVNYIVIYPLRKMLQPQRNGNNYHLKIFLIEVCNGIIAAVNGRYWGTIPFCTSHNLDFGNS